MVVQTQNLTVEQYHAVLEQSENGERLFELIAGEIVEKMPSFEPSRIAIQISFLLKLYLREHRIGDVTGSDGGYLLAPDTVVIPDVGYIARERLPEKPRREAPVAPDLAVEVKSPTDSIRGLRAKAELYQKHGTKLVWLVFPETQTVEVYALNQDVSTRTLNDTLDGGDVLPGFTLAVRDIFEG